MVVALLTNEQLKLRSPRPEAWKRIQWAAHAVLDAMICTPWALSGAYQDVHVQGMAAMCCRVRSTDVCIGGRVEFLKWDGIGDPSGRTEGFAFVRQKLNRTRRSAAQKRMDDGKIIRKKKGDRQTRVDDLRQYTNTQVR